MSSLPPKALAQSMLVLCLAAGAGLACGNMLPTPSARSQQFTPTIRRPSTPLPTAPVTQPALLVILATVNPALARVTPSASAFQVTDAPTASPTASRVPEATQAPADTSTAAPEAPSVAAVLRVGHTAIVAPGHTVSVRQEADSQSLRLGQLAPNTQVALLGGPQESGGLRWWQIDDHNGLSGWVAAGINGDVWLLPVAAGEPTSTLIAG